MAHVVYSGALLWVVAGLTGCQPKSSVRLVDSAGTLTLPSSPAPLRASARLAVQNADSIVFERTACFGSCPAYRLRIARAGAVAFRSLNVGDSTRREAGSVAAEDLEELLQFADGIGFVELPDTIIKSRAYCGRARSDHATAITTIYAGAGFKRVVDYQGCRWAPVGLRQFEDRIDALVNTERWIRPNNVWAVPPPA